MEEAAEQKARAWGLTTMVAQRAGERTGFTRSVSIAAVALTVIYPGLVYIGWHRVSPRVCIGGMMLLLGLRLYAAGFSPAKSSWRESLTLWLPPGIFLGVAFLLGRRSLALYWPVVVSATLLITFGRTLAYPPPIIERFARLQKPVLTPDQINYCRTVTQVWCLFFILNGTIAGYLAYESSLARWTLYNGLIAYLLIGGLVVSEYVYRHWRFRPNEALLSRWMDHWSR